MRTRSSRAGRRAVRRCIRRRRATRRARSSSPTANQIRTYAFGRVGDTTAYETSVLDATPANLADQAKVLGAGGYIITAFGRVGDNAMILVGTRIPGAAARTITVQRPPLQNPDMTSGDA